MQTLQFMLIISLVARPGGETFPNAPGHALHAVVLMIVYATHSQCQQLQWIRCLFV